MTVINIRRYNTLNHRKILSRVFAVRSSESRSLSPMIHISMAAVFNHIFVYLQAILREKDPETRILLTMYPIQWALSPDDRSRGNYTNVGGFPTHGRFLLLGRISFQWKCIISNKKVFFKKLILLAVSWKLMHLKCT